MHKQVTQAADSPRFSSPWLSSLRSLRSAGSLTSCIYARVGLWRRGWGGSEVLRRMASEEQARGPPFAFEIFPAFLVVAPRGPVGVRLAVLARGADRLERPSAHVTWAPRPRSLGLPVPVGPGTRTHRIRRRPRMPVPVPVPVPRRGAVRAGGLGIEQDGVRGSRHSRMFL